MIIWQYRYPWGVDGDQRIRFGCPVDVTVGGRQIRAVYQFQGSKGNDQQCAVVHHASGRILAPVTDAHTGYPEERAQQAVDERLGGKTPASIWRVIDAAETLNLIGAVI